MSNQTTIIFAAPTFSADEFGIYAGLRAAGKREYRVDFHDGMECIGDELVWATSAEEAVAILQAEGIFPVGPWQELDGHIIRMEASAN